MQIDNSISARIHHSIRIRSHPQTTMADAGRSRRARTTADGGTGTCLSDLSDDLLRHIVFLAPDKDGAATAVLSRRWRWLWRTSGAVHIDSRSFISGCSSPDEELEVFHRGGEEALAAAAAALVPIRRLTFSIAENSKITKKAWCCTPPLEHSLMEALVSHPAARLIEELQIEVKSSESNGCMMCFPSLPFEALQVLRLIECAPTPLTPPPAAFPMLVELHLEDCGMSLVYLQSIIDASPLLSALHLASFSLYIDDEQGRLVIQGVSALVLTECTFSHKHGLDFDLDLDLPRLQRFRYKGCVEGTDRIRLKLQASAKLVHVDLDFDLSHGYNYGIKSPTPTRELFWRFIQGFNTAKLLKLKMYYRTMDNVALIDKASRDELLGGLSFSHLEQLELDAEYKPGWTTSMAMLANLLHCCPTVRDIRIKLTKQHEECHWIEPSIIDKQARLRFDKSVSGFRNRRRRSVVSLGGQNDVKYGALDIPGLTGEHSFNCLKSHLKRVSLQFFMDEPNCLGIQVAKFFAKNAMVLQEMHIDDGRQEMLEHVNSSSVQTRCNNQLKVKY